MSDILGLSVALDGLAVSQYSDWPFTSFFQMDGQVYATAPDGLYRIGGDDDAGEAIVWAVDGPKTDFGRDDIKRVREVLLSGANTTNASVALAFDSGDTPSVQAVREGRFSVGRNGQGRRVQFTVSGEGPVEVSSVTLDVLSLGRRR